MKNVLVPVKTDNVALFLGAKPLDFRHVSELCSSECLIYSEDGPVPTLLTGTIYLKVSYDSRSTGDFALQENIMNIAGVVVKLPAEDGGTSQTETLTHDQLMYLAYIVGKAVSKLNPEMKIYTKETSQGSLQELKQSPGEFYRVLRNILVVPGFSSQSSDDVKIYSEVGSGAGKKQVEGTKKISELRSLFVRHISEILGVSGNDVVHHVAAMVKQDAKHAQRSSGSSIEQKQAWGNGTEQKQSSKETIVSEIDVISSTISAPLFLAARLADTFPLESFLDKESANPSREVLRQISREIISGLCVKDPQWLQALIGHLNISESLREHSWRVEADKVVLSLDFKTAEDVERNKWPILQFFHGVQSLGNKIEIHIGNMHSAYHQVMNYHHNLMQDAKVLGEDRKDLASTRLIQIMPALSLGMEEESAFVFIPKGVSSIAEFKMTRDSMQQYIKELKNFSAQSPDSLLAQDVNGVLKLINDCYISLSSVQHLFGVLDQCCRADLRNQGSLPKLTERLKTQCKVTKKTSSDELRKVIVSLQEKIGKLLQQEERYSKLLKATVKLFSSLKKYTIKSDGTSRYKHEPVSLFGSIAVKVGELAVVYNYKYFDQKKSEGHKNNWVKKISRPPLLKPSVQSLAVTPSVVVNKQPKPSYRERQVVPWDLQSTASSNDSTASHLSNKSSSSVKKLGGLAMMGTKSSTKASQRARHAAQERARRAAMARQASRSRTSNTICSGGRGERPQKRLAVIHEGAESPKAAAELCPKKTGSRRVKVSRENRKGLANTKKDSKGLIKSRRSARVKKRVVGK